MWIEMVQLDGKQVCMRSEDIIAFEEIEGGCRILHKASGLNILTTTSRCPYSEAKEVICHKS